ncbi:MAG: hypothetical protein AB8B59_06455 [Maribacter sp.]
MIDRGSEEQEKLNTGRSAIAWIEMNKPEEIINYLSEDSKVDKSLLASNCKSVSEEFPFEDALPGFFSNDEKNSIWYERTYYKKTNDSINYLLQIYIDLVTENGQSKILNIDFRRGKDIIDRNTEVQRLNRSGKNGIPPPPPPPPALPIKH